MGDFLYPGDLAALTLLSERAPEPIPRGSGPTGGACPPGQPGPLQGYLVEIDDTLRFSILVTGGPKTVTFYGTRIDCNNEIYRFSQTVTGNDPNTPATATLTTGAGTLQGVGATAVGGIGGATIYVLAEVGDSQGGTFMPRLQLLSGLMTGFGIASGTIVAGGGGGGGGSGCCVPSSLDLVFMPASVAGRSDDSFATPAPNSFRFRNCGAFFDTTACAVNTYIGLGVSESGQDDYYVRHPTPIPPGITGRFTFFRGGSFAAVNNTEWTAPIPDQIIISGGGISLGQSDGDLNMVLTDPYYSREFYAP